MSTSSSTNGIWFPTWSEALAKTRLRDFERLTYRLTIFEYLRFCKYSRQRATLASARNFMQQVEERRRLPLAQPAIWKAALNWFFQSAKSAGPNPPMPANQPPAAPATRGSATTLRLIAAWTGEVQATKIFTVLSISCRTCTQAHQKCIAQPA